MVQGRRQGALYEGGGHKLIDEGQWAVVENTHEPIVSQELFDRAKAVMDSRTAAYKDKEGMYDQFVKPEMILKDLVFCADCGKPLFRYKSVKKKYNRVYWIYQCRSHNNLLNCPHKYIHEKDLYAAVYALLRFEIQVCAEIGSIIEKLNRASSHKERMTRFDKEIGEAERELRRIASLRQGVYDDYASKLLTVSEYQFAVAKYDADVEKQRGRFEAASRERAEYTQNSTPVNKWLSAFTRFMDAGELTSDIARALIERVEVSERDNVTVTFKFRDEFAAVCSTNNINPNELAVAV